MLGYVYSGQANERFGHAVVAYAIESGLTGVLSLGSSERFQYDTRIHIYNNLSMEDSIANDLLTSTNARSCYSPLADIVISR